jgi:predicted RNase H-like HicB family nuclease
MTLRYTILIEFDADGPGYVVFVPALPGCLTQGATVPEAIKRAREAIAGHVAALQDIGEDVPTEDVPALMTVVEIDALAASGR